MSSMNDRGSVSLYAVIVLVPIVLFLGFLFDLARYRAADKMAEQQTKAAVRSVLSGYDRTLREEYGLFGLAAGEEERLAMAGMSFAQTGGGFSAVSPRLVELAAEPVYFLADHRLFRRQILEEMKVKGAVEFTRRVFDNMKKQAEDMEKSARTAEWSEEVEKLLQDREEALRNAYRAVERMDAFFRQGYAILSAPPPLPPEPPAPAEGGGPVQAGPLPVYNPYTGAMTVFYALQSQLDALREQLRQAEHAEERIRSAMDDEDGDLLAGVSLLGHAFYERYALDAGHPVSLFGSAAMRANADPYNWTNDLSFDAAFQSFFTRISAEETARRAGVEDLEKRKEKQRGEVRKQLDKVKDALSKQVCTPEQEQLYGRLAELYGDYLQYNTAEEGTGLAPDPAAIVYTTPEKSHKSALLLLRNLSGILAAIRDEALVNEYVMLYFGNRTTGLDGQPLMESVNRHPLKQEAEYVLYGLGSCTANQAAAQAELFAVRFAIRTSEALVDVRKAAAGSPMLVLLTAAAEGAAKAYADMERLLDGQSVPVFQRLPNLRMGYADYLRAFLALHSDETKKMARIQALIELNTGIRLTERAAYVMAVSRSELDLYLFPAVARRLLADAEKGEGRSVFIVKRAEMAY